MSRLYTLPPTIVISTEHAISSELLLIFNKSKVLYHMKQYPDQKPSNFDIKKVIAEHVVQKEKDYINPVKNGTEKIIKNKMNGNKPMKIVNYKNMDYNYVIVTRETNFYAERGGQMSDTGNILLLDETVHVCDCQWYENVILQFVRYEGNEKTFNEKIKKIYLEEQRLMKIVKNIQQGNIVPAQEKIINGLYNTTVNGKEPSQIKTNAEQSQKSIEILERNSSENIKISDHFSDISQIEKNGRDRAILTENVLKNETMTPEREIGVKNQNIILDKEIGENRKNKTVPTENSTQNETYQTMTLDREIEKNKIICSMSPDIYRRDCIRINHTATHLLNQQISLFGGCQKGSLVEAYRFRFDYSVPTIPSGKIKADGSLSKELNHKRVELAIRHAIRLKRKVSIEIFTKDELKQQSEIWKKSVFMQKGHIEKYPQSVRVIHTPTVVSALKTDTELVNQLKKESEEYYRKLALEKIGDSNDQTGSTDLNDPTDLNDNQDSTDSSLLHGRVRPVNFDDLDDRLCSMNFKDFPRPLDFPGQEDFQDINDPKDLGNINEQTTSTTVNSSEKSLSQFEIDSFKSIYNGTKKKEPFLTEYEKQQEANCLWLFFPTDHRELCGGLHVRNTNDIRDFLILSDTTISAGIKRITAITGEVAAEMRFVDNMLKSELEKHQDTLNEILKIDENEEKKPAHIKKSLTNEQIRKLISFFKRFMSPGEPQSLIIREEFLHIRNQIFKEESRLKKTIFKSYGPETWKKAKGKVFPYNLFLEDTIVETLYAQKLYGDKKTVIKDLNSIFIQKRKVSRHSLICFATAEGKCVFVGTEDILGHRSIGGRVTGELDITEDVENFLDRNSNI